MRQKYFWGVLSPVMKMAIANRYGVGWKEPLPASFPEPEEGLVPEQRRVLPVDPSGPGKMRDRLKNFNQSLLKKNINPVRRIIAQKSVLRLLLQVQAR